MAEPPHEANPQAKEREVIFENDDHDNYDGDDVLLIIMMKNVQNLNMKPVPGKRGGGDI